MTEQWGEQMSFFDPDLWCGKMYPEACPAPVKDTAGKTSRPSSTKSAKSSAKKLPLFLCLKEAGPMQDASAEWVTAESPFPLPTDYTMHSFGESPSVERESRLSQILEDSTPQKYYLSERACLGILNRASKRGKELPQELKAALLRQCGSGGCVQSDD